MVILPERGCASVFLQSNTCVCNICKLFGRITGDARFCFPLIFVCAGTANNFAHMTGEKPLILWGLAHYSLSPFGFKFNSVSQCFADSCLLLLCSLYKIAVCLKVAVSSRRHRNSDISGKFSLNKHQTPLLYNFDKVDKKLNVFCSFVRS